MDAYAKKIAGYSKAHLSLLCLELKKRLDAAEGAATEPIAIVGMSCRFPGGANSPDAYWQLLRQGRDAIAPIPEGRWDQDSYYDADPDATGKMYCQYGGFLDELDGFEPQLFNISPREASSLDPQHRILLELTWEALEDAGQDPTSLRGTRTGVFVGFGSDDFTKNQLLDLPPERFDIYLGTGGGYCYGGGRLSHTLGLNGPNVSLETACSSSLVALHLACQSLRMGECPQAIAGGVHLWMSPVGGIFLSKVRALAPDGRCKTFDSRADGFVRGEGGGVVVLKRLSDAKRDGDQIHAVIRASAINHDGPSSALTVPYGPAQQAVIETALRQAKVQPHEIGYVEAHGTGTPLGDPIEVRSLAKVLGRAAGRSADNPLVIGSVKTNFGHLEAAAGIAGVLKVVLALKREVIPPHLHFRQANSEICLEDGPFIVPTESISWGRGSRKRLAGVSSFGMSGTNAHAILEEAPRAIDGNGDSGRPAHLLTLRARSEAALRQLATRYADHLSEHPSLPLQDVCATANTGRTAWPWRLAAVADSGRELGEKLRALAADEPSRDVVRGQAAPRQAPKVAFLFPGQGAQRVGMGRELYEAEPAFRQAIDECDGYLRPYLDRSLPAMLRDEDAPLDETATTQPVLFALGYALAAMWQHWGIRPDAVLGHSVGEYVAACVAGSLSLEDAATLIAERGRLMQALPADGGMVAVLASAEQVEPLLRPVASQVSLAAVNGPRSVVLSGLRTTLERLCRELAARTIQSRWLPVSHAFHSPLMDPILDTFEELVASRKLGKPKLPLISNLNGRPVDDEIMQPSYWRRHARECVRFADGLSCLANQGFEIFLECGPASTLLGMGRKCLPAKEGTWLPSMRAEAPWHGTLRTLGALYAKGADVSWSRFHGDAWQRRSLPTYPFERRRYWLDLDMQRPQPKIVLEQEGRQDPELGPVIDELFSAWGGDGVMAINRRVTSPWLLLTPARKSLFCFNQRREALLVTSYVGPPAARESSIEYLLRYTRSRELDLTLFVHGHHAESLARMGLSTTPVGVWQTLADTRSFDLHGGRMKRLRSKFNAFDRTGQGRVDECRVGDDSRVDQQIVEMIGHWVKRKGRKAPFVSELERQIRSGALHPGHRLFLVYATNDLESVILLSPIPQKNGHLMDLEFYRQDVRPGALEFGIVRILELLRAEGSTYLSLGSTFGTQLSAHENEDPEVAALLGALHDQGLLNEDGNFEFKKKFAPAIEPFYISRLKGAGTASIATVLAMLSGKEGGDFDGVVADPSDDSPKALAPHADERDQNALERETFHPLLGNRLSLAVRDVVFHAVLSTDLPHLAFLGEHRVFERIVLPGAAYIETALAGAEHVLGARPCVLEDLHLQEALVLRDEERLDVQTIFARDSAGALTFQVSSARRKDESGEWIVHGSGRVTLTESAEALAESAKESLPTLRERCTDSVDIESFYRVASTHGIAYGPSFRCIEELWSGEGEALGRVVLPDRLAEAGSRFVVHPVLLDACLQFPGIAWVSLRGEAEPGINYLPFRLGRFCQYRPWCRELWSHVRIRPVADERPESLVMDVSLFDRQGNRVAELSEFAARRTSRDVMRLLLRDDAEDLLYEMRWQPAARHAKGESDRSAAGRRDVAEVRTPEVGAWLVTTDTDGLGDLVADALAARGAEVVVVRPPPIGASSECLAAAEADDAAEFRKIFREAARQSADTTFGIVHCCSSSADIDFESESQWVIRDAQNRGSRRLLAILDELSAAGVAADGAKVWCVTRNAQPIHGGAVDPSLAPLWGLGRTIAQEHPELWGGMVDLPPTAGREETGRLAGELLRGDGEDHVAFRGNERLVARLTACDAAQPTSGSLAFRANATYLVTGGLGGLGLTVARWLVDRGARHLALLGRTGNDTGTASADLASLREAGASLVILKADCSQKDALASAIEEIHQSQPPLRGVFHAAGVLADALLQHQTWPQFREVMAPKIDASWHLHSLTRDIPLDYFVLFSSAASLLGAAGQGNYAAANAFLDGLAHYRHALNLPATTINWGPWSEVGMAAALGSQVESQKAERGLGTISPAEGCRILEQILIKRPAQVGVVRADWDLLLRSPAAALRQTSLFRDWDAARSNGVAGSKVEEFEGLSEGNRVERLGNYLTEQLARVLGLESSEVRRDAPLMSMGFDSLMGLELREQVESDLGVTLPMVNILRGDHVDDFALHLARALEGPAPGDMLSPAGRPPQVLSAARPNEEPGPGLFDIELSASLVQPDTGLTVRLAPAEWPAKRQSVRVEVSLTLRDDQGDELRPIGTASIDRPEAREFHLDTQMLENGIYLIDYVLTSAEGKVLVQLWRRFAVQHGVNARLARLRERLEQVPEPANTANTANAARATVAEILSLLSQAQEIYLARNGETDTPKASQARGLNRQLKTRLPFEAAEQLDLAENIVTALHDQIDPFECLRGDLRLSLRSAADGAIVPYRLYVPDAFELGASWPLVILLHGILGDECSFFELENGQCKRLAERNSCILLAPAGRGPGGSHNERTSSDLFEMTRQAREILQLREAPIYLAGHSMGSEWAWKIGFGHSERIAALGLISGVPIYEEAAELVGRSPTLPVRQYHGVRDPISKIDVARRIATLADSTLLDYQFVEYADRAHHDVAELAMVEIFEFFVMHSIKATQTAKEPVED